MLPIGKQLPCHLPSRLFPLLFKHGHLRRMHNLVLSPDERQERRLLGNTREGDRGVPFLPQEQGDVKKGSDEREDEGDEGPEGIGSVFDDDPVDLREVYSGGVRFVVTS